MEKALYYEDVEGDLEKAVELYEHVLKHFSENREIAAKAQYQVGICYEKLGLKKAQQAFERVVDNFPEQTAVVELARKRLAGLVKAQASAEGGEKRLNVRQLLSGPELLYDGWQGGVSPDGRYVSLVDWERASLAIRELATGKKQQLTDQKTESGFPLYSRWSKDGTRIAYDWWQGDSFAGVRTIGIGEKEPRTIYEDENIKYALPLDWFPDGERLLTAVRTDDENRNGQLAVLNLKNKMMRRLPLRSGDNACLDLAGRYIAYDKAQNEGLSPRDIFLFSLEDEEDLPLIEHPANDEILGWSPDGRWVLFRSSRLGSVDAWIIAVS